MNKEINHTWFFNQSPEEVWEYLTKAELISQWLMPNNFEPIVGHEFEFRTNPIPSLNINGIMRCKVLEIIPLKKLTYTWTGGPDEQTISFDTIVEWTLKTKDNGTELQVLHTGFQPGNEALYLAMEGGWQHQVQKMFSLFNKND